MAEAGGDFYLCILCGCVPSSKFSNESDYSIPYLCVLETLCEMDEASNGICRADGGSTVCPLPDRIENLPGYDGRYGLFYCAGDADFGLWLARRTAVCVLRGNEPAVGGDLKWRGSCFF